jgi:hypothetical protein
MVLGYLVFYMYIITDTSHDDIQGDNEPGGIENATHNTFTKLMWLF